MTRQEAQALIDRFKNAHSAAIIADVLQKPTSDQIRIAALWRAVEAAEGLILKNLGGDK